MKKYINYFKARRLEKIKNWTAAASAYRKALGENGEGVGEWHYRHGFVLFKAKKWGDAERALSIAVRLNPDKAQWQFRRAFALEKLRQWEAALAGYGAAILLDDSRADWHVRRGVCLLALRRWALAGEALQAAVSREPNNAEYQSRLADALRKIGKRWHEIEVLKTAIGLNAGNASWYFRLGEALEAMNRKEEAAEAYQRAIELDPGDASWHYRLGLVLERDGRHAEADAVYAAELKREPAGTAKQLGVGVLHQDRENWREAERAYAARITLDPLHAQLRYRYGRSLERQYRWNEAADAYMAALALDASNADWHYRLGFSLERAHCWNRAAQAYAQAVSRAAKHAPNSNYRLGYVLYKAGRFSEACLAFAGTQLEQSIDVPLQSEGGEVTIEDASHAYRDASSDQYVEALNQRQIALMIEALATDGTRADWYYKLGNAYERLSDWINAARAYGGAVARQHVHTPRWYYRLAYVLDKAGRPEEACRAYLETRILKKPYGASQQAYNTDAGLKLVADFTAYSEALPIAENVVFYESFGGVSISCNPHAIFRHILSREDLRHLVHVWVVENTEDIPQRYRSLSNVIFVLKGSDLYLRYLASAKYIINNATFAPFFIRRSCQIYLNTWHGTPIKAMGKDIQGGVLDGKNVARNFLQATHIISPNSHTTEILLNSYDIAGVYGGLVVESGYPRIDSTLAMDEQGKADLRKRLGIPNGKKIVLYAPTWRGTLPAKAFDAERVIGEIKSLSELDVAVLFRGHYFIEQDLHGSSISSAVVPADIDTNDVLAIVDVLITDYSSIAFDFMATGRPIIYYTYDVEEYAAQRGMYFDMRDMPGTMCMTIEAVKYAIDNSLRDAVELDEKSRAAKQRFCPYDDGAVSERIVDFLFYGRAQQINIIRQIKKTSLLFFAGAFSPNGITSSMISLARQLDPKKFEITVLVDPNGVTSQPERLDQFSQLPTHVRVVGRVGRMNVSPEEKWVIDRFNQRLELESVELWRVYEGAYRREYQRIFGLATFDVAVNFDGYGLFWPSIFAFGPLSSQTRKVIYQHSDMQAEFKLRFPSLAGLFRLYSGYDALVSVSKSVCALNRSALEHPFGIAPENFVYCSNVLSPEVTIARAEDDIPDAEEVLFQCAGKRFIAIGRLSPEKDHEKLIRAFRRVRQEYPDARLFIVGDGPLRSKLESLVQSLELSSAVYFLGFKFNPYPYLKRADCLVLSSNHEGQPLVLLEAMTLGKPVLSTDIDGAHSVLEGREDLLVENSEDGLANGMGRFLNGQLQAPMFDYAAYQQKAIKQFHQHVLGCDDLAGLHPDALNSNCQARPLVESAYKAIA